MKQTLVRHINTPFARQQAPIQKYTYDQVSATVAITVQEKDGELYTVTTTVTKGDDSKEYSSAESKATAVAPFVNSIHRIS